MSKTIESKASKKIELKKLRADKSKFARNKITVNHHFKYYLGNLPIPSLTTLFGRNNAKKISILATYQLAGTNHTRMEDLSLSETTIGSKDIAICSSQLGDKLIAESNQLSAPVDRQWHGDREFPFGSWESGN